MGQAIHGRGGAVEVGTTPTLVGSLTDWTIGETYNEQESTAMGDTSKTYLADLPDGEISLQGWWDALNDAGQQELDTAKLAGTPLDIMIYPDGKGTGKPQYTGQITINGYQAQANVNSLVDFQCSGRGFMTGPTAQT